MFLHELLRTDGSYRVKAEYSLITFVHVCNEHSWSAVHIKRTRIYQKWSANVKRFYLQNIKRIRCFIDIIVFNKYLNSEYLPYLTYLYDFTDVVNAT